MKRISWKEHHPGHFETDLVHHSGQYVHTLQMVDVATGWSEQWAVLVRSACSSRCGAEAPQMGYVWSTAIKRAFCAV